MSATGRTRDPLRRERIIGAATRLFSRQGYQTVNLNEIGTEAGIVGSGIYRHFDSKMAILIELLDQLTDRLNTDAERIARDEPDALTALVLLLSAQIRRTLDDRQLYSVYLQEARHLPAGDFERLRLKQRRYIGVWQEVLLVVRPDITPELARTTILATVSGTHSVLRYHPRMDAENLHNSLFLIGCRSLGIFDQVQSRGVTPESLAANHVWPTDPQPVK